MLAGKKTRWKTGVNPKHKNTRYNDSTDLLECSFNVCTCILYTIYLEPEINATHIKVRERAVSLSRADMLLCQPYLFTT